MKKYIVLASLCLATATGWATQNVNPLLCVYLHDESGWHSYGGTMSEAAYELKNNESRWVGGWWTSERPVPPNYALCKIIVGTNDDEVVNVIGKKVQGTVIDTLGEDCAPIGTDLKVEKVTLSLRKGTFVDLESEWLVAPGPDRLLFRTYLPKDDELDSIRENSLQKCDSLTP
jgi:hypothetical protein